MKQDQNIPRIHIFGCLLAIFLCSLVINSVYRGIAHDGGLSYLEGAKVILAGDPLLDPHQNLGSPKYPARFVYIALIALATRIVGVTLLALHLFPFLIQLINPCLVFLLVARTMCSVKWGLFGALLFSLHPFSVVSLNHHSEGPIFLCLLLFLMLFSDLAGRHVAKAIFSGVCAALLILTRFEEGLLFLFFLILPQVLSHWRSKTFWAWSALAGASFAAVIVICAVIFQFPIFYPAQYLPALIHRQERYGEGTSFYGLTKQALIVFVQWYLCGKFLAPLLVLLSGIGVFEAIKRRHWQLLGMCFPYLGFLLFVYNARTTPTNMVTFAFITPAFLILVLSGLRLLFQDCAHKCSAWRAGRSAYCHIGLIAISVAMVMFFSRSAYRLGQLSDEVIPASSFWRVAQANPPLPGHPDYHEPFVRLTREERFFFKYREELYRAVRGRYRAWNLAAIGHYAFEKDFPALARQHADFSYFDDYDSPEQWQRDRYHQEGSSLLWTPAHPGRLGAFPTGSDGTFVYEFDLPRPIDTVVISDTHTQWGPRDRVELWTSPDGQKWTRRYGEHGARFKDDHYYQFFEDEFEGTSTLYVKYYFRAGDKGRAPDDNRGASLKRFEVAITYAQ